ncbi:MAG: FHA domain-containing protein [Salinibacter sp.]|uniref:FHA domain-containing protein n=1 Tax=Salinibacter sp. TaxID=2065818 RepID=UPI0035D46E2F
MPVKLRVVNTETEADDPSEYLFDQDRVTIGRDSENDLTLPDPHRIVSKEHAVIRKEGGTYQLVDRGSKNFTYLHDQRLTAGDPYELAEGDIFSIGNFEITFVPTGPPFPSPATDETVFAADFSNPFADPAQNLSEALANLIETYEQEAPQRREDALKDAFRRTDTELENHEAVRRVLDLLGVPPSSTASSPASSEDTPARSSSSSPSAEAPPDTESQRPSSPASASSPSTPSVRAENDAIDEVLDTLVEALSRIIGIPWQFRHEFIGQTIMQSAETDFLYSGDASTMKDHLLDPSISQDERRKRLDHVEDAAEALAVHQVAMLNGYKASVTKGAEELMDRLNPEVYRAEITEENVVYEYFPMLASPAVVERLQSKWNDLKRGDWSAAEQRIFRPAFIKAYLARMTAANSSGKDTTGEE